MILRIRNIRDREAISGYIRQLPDGKKYDIHINLKREKRSLPQNRLYWMWLTCISDDTGSDKDQLHKEFSKMFLHKDTVVGIGGELVEVPVSTTKLNSAQFTDYLNNIQVFAASELGIVLPLPEDDAWNLFVDHYDK